MRGFGPASFGEDQTESDRYFQQKSIEAFRNSPEDSIAGAARSIEADETFSLIDLAWEDRERFLSLVECLSPVVQDIFFQYYLLGRTYAQIGAVLFPSKGRNAAEIQVKRGKKLGLMAIGAILAFGGKPTRAEMKRSPEMARHYTSMLKFQRGPAKKVKLKADGFSGFEIPASADLSYLFAPSWSVLGCRGSGR